MAPGIIVCTLHPISQEAAFGFEFFFYGDGVHPKTYLSLCCLPMPPKTFNNMSAQLFE